MARLILSEVARGKDGYDPELLVAPEVRRAMASVLRICICVPALHSDPRYIEFMTSAAK